MAHTGTLSLFTIFLLSTSSPTSAAAAPSSAATLLQQPPLHHPSPSPSSSSASDPPEYKIYIVLLKPREDGADLTMEDDARRDWHTSLLPSALTVHGKKRLICSYKTLFQGFAAYLTDEEVDDMKTKPGFGTFFPEEEYEMHTTSF
ncbi:hypothetical protein BS78_01G414000 [Paspalum vaginatum]|nr:hypothetical protein BS78_01G414000 [Paspalum vaginatum]